MRVIKATREQLKRHNRQLVLRAVYYGLADNRAALANETGLAKPTISDLVVDLIHEGLLIEGGRGESTDSGGKRPTILRFVPDARQIIGVSVESHRVTGVLSNLEGKISAQHYIEFEPDGSADLVALMRGVINGMIAQLEAPLLCIGVGVPGAVDTTSGFVRHSPYTQLNRLALGEMLATYYQKPVYVGNNGELSALAQFAFGVDATSPSENLVTLLVTDTVEIGIALNHAVYHHGGDIGSLQICVGQHMARIDSVLPWPQVCARVEALRESCGGSALPAHGLTYFHIRYHAARGDSVAQVIVDELTEHLAQVMTWLIGLLRPDHISLAGAVVNLGDDLLQSVSHHITALIAPELAGAVTFSLAYSGNLSAIGAVAQALKGELDIV